MAHSYFLFALPVLIPRMAMCNPASDKDILSCRPMDADDEDLLRFAWNIERTEAEYFMHGAFGKGVDSIAPSLAMGGPPPVGPRKADLDGIAVRIMEEFVFFTRNRSYQVSHGFIIYRSLLTMLGKY